MEFNKLLKVKSNHIEDILKQYMPKEEGYQKIIMESMNYSLNAGGKIAIARCGENLTVCIFLSIGLLHLDDVVIGLAHRSVPANL